MSVSDPYKVLQVDSEAEDEVIEAAYRRLARKYHPDVAPGPDAQDRMVRINQAWEMLRDPARRAAVDRARARATTQSARVAAADAQARAAAAGSAGYSPGPADGRHSAVQPVGAPGPAAGWPLPGMRDPSDDSVSSPSPRPQTEAAAGPPPGNPSGSVLTFGRFAGWSLGEIARTELQYLEWLDRMPIGRIYQHEIDALLRKAGRRTSAAQEQQEQRGLFRRR